MQKIQCNDTNKNQIIEEITNVEENEENEKLNKNQRNNNIINWTKVEKNKNKEKDKKKVLFNEFNTNEQEEIESITSFKIENDYQTGWCNVLGAKKYKLWI
ncbi:8864_t:CDS:2 [Diversispora eburnea]|uniref:8864_t:CDS:1 n=1 Tax=Diversispora eburnea TaxID=1213867 RepID=A0A9N9G6Y8_9GLOM|nr:8864_t:CDS:2 [Diversispora eburnea]